VIKIKTEANARQGFLDRAQFDLLRAKLPDYLAPLVSWMYATGWRVAEAESLRWADLDEGEGIARIDGSRTKNGEAKSFAFAELDLAREAIEAARAARREGCPWLFHRKGRRLRSFYKAWRRACASVAAKLREDDPESATALLFDKLIPHDMRRSTTRNLILSCVGEQVAMKIVGHKTASTFRRYNITTQEDIRHASKLLNEFMARKPESTGNKGETTSDETPASSQ
jgi:integrase